MPLTKASFSMIDGEIASIRDFGAVGNGIADDTAALTAFWNSAIANPGVCHMLDAATYLITAALPVINVSNVWIQGSGAEIHDNNDLMTGTVIKWGGPAAPTAVMCRIYSVSGAGNSRIANVTLDGVGFDCNYGAAGYGVEILSAQDCLINVAVANASQQGVSMNVVAALGETKDNQRNTVRITGRQVEANGFVLAIGGDNIANTSMNTFEIDCQHKDSAAIYCVNSDNNDWRFVRCFRVGGGTATESITLLGSNTFGTNSRAERFWFLTATVPLHAYGTGTYTYGSTGNQIFSLDLDNGSPAPIVDAGAEVNWRYDKTWMPDNAWAAYTPTITSFSGSLGAVSNVVGFYRKIGKRLDLKIGFTIDNNGTGSVGLVATLPFASVGSVGQVCAGKERNITGAALTGFIDSSSPTMFIQKYDGTYPGVASGVYNISGFYQVQS